MLTTLSRKMIMGLTGLFLCVFLIIHFLGNLQLFLPAEEAQLAFNWYSQLLTGNSFIKLVSYVLYASIIVHVIDSIIITQKNKKAGIPYAKDGRDRASKWYSRNMGILGTIILFFLVVHFKNFWYVYKFGEIPLDSDGQKDLYTVVVHTFQEVWYVILYVVSMIALCYHLIHGIHSAFRTLGLYHPVYVKWGKAIAVVFAVVICTGFALMPIYIFLSF